MKIGPTIDKRVKLLLDDDGDFYLLSQLIQDASNSGNIEKLANQVGENVTEDDWEEFVKPDLIAKYKSDIIKVNALLKKAHEEKAAEIFISQEDFQEWYSTLNQARLHLESTYNLSSLHENVSPEEVEQELLEPVVKGNFYTHLQSLILEFLEW